MARILIADQGRWYDELRSVAYYSEADIERWILQHAKSLFPYHFVLPFKLKVVSKKTGDKKKPDLALIRRDFSAWTVVEVELGHHEISHVLDQTRVFADGEFRINEMAEYARKQLKKQCNRIVSLDRLRKFFNEHAPSVLVIADVHATKWEQELSDAGVDFCVFEVYKNVVGHHVYRSFGQYPGVPADEAHCRPHKSMANVIEVVGDIKFKKSQVGAPVEVSYDECLTRWEPFKINGRQYLRFMGMSNPLSPNDTYGLFRDKSQKYFFKRS
jgi:hypothetical protein